MRMNRRTFLRSTAAAGAGLGVATRTASDAMAQGATDRPGSGGADAGAQGPLPAAIRALTPMTAGIVPITDEERRGRIEKARRLLTENRVDAVILEDCLYITENGAKFFTQPSPSIEQPFA